MESSFVNSCFLYLLWNLRCGMFCCGIVVVESIVMESLVVDSLWWSLCCGLLVVVYLLWNLSC